jgi:hypothetical protein
MMPWRITSLLILLLVSTPFGPGHTASADSQAVADPLYSGLPPQEPDSARLGIQDPAEIAMQVSIKRKTLRCDELEGHVEILQHEGTHLESYACFGVDRPGALTELVVGQGVERHYYRITFDYSRPAGTVTYTIKRMAGAGIISSQRVVLDLRLTS